jgi:hypothetical protein
MGRGKHKGIVAYPASAAELDLDLQAHDKDGPAGQGLFFAPEGHFPLKRPAPNPHNESKTSFTPTTKLSTRMAL